MNKINAITKLERIIIGIIIIFIINKFINYPFESETFFGFERHPKSYVTNVSHRILKDIDFFFITIVLIVRFYKIKSKYE